eukprot:291658-Hanusia_phi.AAC.1
MMIKSSLAAPGPPYGARPTVPGPPGGSESESQSRDPALAGRPPPAAPEPGSARPGPGDQPTPRAGHAAGVTVL